MNKKMLLEVLQKEVINVLVKENLDYIGKEENLKLYEAGYNCEDIALFNDFCMLEYNDFKEYVLEENYCKLEYIGRTSSFYVIPDEKKIYTSLSYMDYLELSHSNNDDKLRALANDFLYQYIDGDIVIEKINNGKIISIEDMFFNEEEMYKNSNEYYVYDDLIADIKRHIRTYIDDVINNPVKVYKYIKNFKDNQMVNFEEYLQCIKENY